MSNFIDNDISLFINNKNKDKFFKDFNDNLKDKKRDFNDNFNNITVSLFTGIGNNTNVYNKLMNLKMNKRCKNKMIVLDITIVIKILRVFKIYRLNEMII